MTRKIIRDTRSRKHFWQDKMEIFQGTVTRWKVCGQCGTTWYSHQRVPPKKRCSTN